MDSGLKNWWVDDTFFTFVWMTPTQWRPSCWSRISLTLQVSTDYFFPSVVVGAVHAVDIPGLEGMERCMDSFWVEIFESVLSTIELLRGEEKEWGEEWTIIMMLASFNSCRHRLIQWFAWWLYRRCTLYREPFLGSCIRPVSGAFPVTQAQTHTHTASVSSVLSESYRHSIECT